MRSQQQTTAAEDTLGGCRGGRCREYLLKQQMKQSKLFIQSNCLPQVSTCAISTGNIQFRWKLDVIDDETINRHITNDSVVRHSLLSTHLLSHHTLTESVFGQSGTQYEESTQKTTIHGFCIGSWVKTLFQDQHRDLRIQDQDQGLNLQDQDQDRR